MLSWIKETHIRIFNLFHLHLFLGNVNPYPEISSSNLYVYSLTYIQKLSSFGPVPGYVPVYSKRSKLLLLELCTKGGGQKKEVVILLQPI